MAERIEVVTAGPVWNGGSQGEPEKLASCYRESLRLLVENGLSTIAFPAISCGVYGYPLDQAAGLAVETIREFLGDDDQIEKVYLVAFDESVGETFRDAIRNA